MAISTYNRYCLNMQGYSGFTDEAKRQIDLAQRFKPASCAALAIAALASQSVVITYIGVVLGFWAALLPYHPVDLVYQAVLRPLLRAPDLGTDPVPRRFACGMAASLLLVGAIGWQAGVDIVGWVFVGMTAASLSVLVLSDFCLGSFSYWLLVKRQMFRPTKT